MFAFYWVLQSVSTVGYGDYTAAAGNTDEYLFTLFLEFTGIVFFSALTFKMQIVVKRKISHDSRYHQFMQDLNLWIKKLELTDREKHIKPALYYDIIRNVEDAFSLDFDMIIDEFSFYQKLPPKRQTELVDFIFRKFKKDFANFFDPCETGFVNELIVNLTAFNMPP